MDISKPVGSEITSVDFGVLSADEIRRLSSKTNYQIQQFLITWDTQLAVVFMI